MKRLLGKGHHGKRLTQEQSLGASLNVTWPLDSLVMGYPPGLTVLLARDLTECEVLFGHP